MKYYHLPLIVGIYLSLSISVIAATPVAPDDWSYARNTSNRNFGDEIRKERSYDEDDLVSIYRLRKGELTDYLKTSDDVASSDKVIWDLFLTVADKKTLDKQMYVYATFEDANAGLLAYVTKLGKKEKTWALVVNANAANPKSKAWKREIGVVLIHEYAHLFMFSSSQLDTKKRIESACKKLGTILVPKTGCARKGSYLDTFVKKFWSEADLKVAKKDREERTTSLYEGRRNDFVTEYAASSPLEDIAESFTDFVLKQKPGGAIITTGDEKVLFFYDYPELVQMRDTIRNNIGEHYR